MDFLFEIGLEEIPARMIAAAEAELRQRLLALLERERLLSGDAAAASYSTPRRLAVHISGVSKRQQDLTEQLLGPAVTIAYRDGVPGPAALAFARKAGVEPAALERVSTPKGEYVAASVTRPGREASEVLVAELPKELAALYWAKNMYWRAGRPERFVRPVRWLLALLGEAVVPVAFGGYTAGRETFGHRVLHGPAPIRIDSSGSYLAQLHEAFVMAGVELRRHTIRKALDRVCRTLPNARWREDHALVDQMTHLTEWPSVIAGAFEPEFLALPEEVLVTVMRGHQNYFAVEDAEGKLAPHFLAVLNTVAGAAGEAVIRHGNERVLRARFNDARFFWQFDQRISLEQRVSLLEAVTFQRDLGSYALKSVRVANLVETLGGLLAGRGFPVDRESLATAARLAKTDLTTELVKEFTELQGEVGGLYARTQGVSACAADAIYDQYRPTSMEDRIPRTPEGQLLALADKLDTIAGMFSLGLEPTGSKDPFALRRAANGIVRILAEGELPLTLADLVSDATQPHATKLLAFFAERLGFYLREARQHAYDVVKAVLALGATDVRDAVARAEAVTAVRSEQTATFLAVCAGFKRMRNIFDQAQARGVRPAPGVSDLLLSEAAEKELAEAGSAAASEVKSDVEAMRYREALGRIAALRPIIDAFFDQVVVMSEDPGVRANRLALLARTAEDFGGIADFSEIVVAGS